MNGFVTASMFIYFTCQTLDDGFCVATNLAAFQRDANKKQRFSQFIEHFYHVLDVPKIEGIAVQTESQCLPAMCK